MSQDREIRAGEPSATPEAVACWSCGEPAAAPAESAGSVATAGPTLFCAACGAVQPPGQHDHFARFGFDRGFDLDPEKLEQAYFRMQRQLHPDRFAGRPDRERLLSMQQSTTVNEAYETLKSPLKRAEYLLSLAGVTVNAETGNLPTDPETLAEAMAHREALEEASDEAAVAALADQVTESRDACLAALGEAFAAENLDDAASRATRLKYLQKFAEELRRKRRTLLAA